MVEELGGDNEDSAEVMEYTEGGITEWTDLKISSVKISFAAFVESERDVYSNRGRDDSINKVIDDEEESEEESSSESSDEDSGPEFMEDGEQRRKISRGFKELNNCRRFWKASLMMGKRELDFPIKCSI